MEARWKFLSENESSWTRRGTSKVRKDEIESLSMQLLREKGQVLSPRTPETLTWPGELAEVRGWYAEEDDEGSGIEAGCLGEAALGGCREGGGHKEGAGEEARGQGHRDRESEEDCGEPREEGGIEKGHSTQFGLISFATGAQQWRSDYPKEQGGSGRGLQVAAKTIPGFGENTYLIKLEKHLETWLMNCPGKGRWSDEGWKRTRWVQVIRI